jgi:hypothetical protein
MGWEKSLVIAGLVFTLIGAGLGFYGVWVSLDQAVEIGVTRLAGVTREENLELPAVQNLLQQSRWAMWGFLLIGFGTLLQIGSVLCAKN